jgi:hypothetical protein
MHGGLYSLKAHAGAIRHPVPGAHKRTMQTFVSSDFENWTTSAHMSFRRDNIPPRPPTDLEFNRGPQVHLGASLWNRGNVFLGFYGMYDNPTNDRRDSRCDIGLLVSPDALHFKEPVPDFKVVPCFEELDRAEPSLVQGQAFENIGDKTYHYYGIWTETNRDGPTGVRVATARVASATFAPCPTSQSHCITCPISLENRDGRVFLNADALSKESRLTVELLDEQFRPLAGYTADDCLPLEKSGLRIPVKWRDHEVAANPDGPIRLHQLVGSRPAASPPTE